MNRIFLLALLVGAALLWLPEDAYAHGGQYRVPGGGVDPGLREPTDPTPPPPPPPPTPPTTPPSTPGTPPPTTPPPTTQPTTPTTPTVPGTQPGTTRKRQAALSYDNWIFWYAYNNADIENLKESIYAQADTNSPLAQMGGGIGNRGSETHDIRTKIKSHIIPLFLWAMDPKNAKHDDVESASYIGLAKVARDPTHIELIVKGLDPKHSKIVRESSALALGLLRRARPEDQFSATDLNKVREKLFDVYRDEDRDTRVRCFAAFGLGLLGDQPTSDEDGSDGASATVAMTRRVFGLLEEDFSPDLTVAALIAVGLMPESTVTEEQREVLRKCVLKSKLHDRTVKTIVPAHAAAALGRIGNSKDVTLLRRALTRRNSDNWLQSSAAIGLGQLAGLISSEERVDLAKGLIGSLKKIKVAQAVNFSLISLAYIVNADAEAGRTDVLADTKTGDLLLKTASSGKQMERPYAALALGLICRQVGENPDQDIYGEFRHKAIVALNDGLNSKSLPPRDQAAFAIGLGMARDSRSIKTLREIVADRSSDREKAGYCALALGLIPARSNKAVLDAITDTLKRTTDEELKIRCATALGLLRDNTAVPMLVKEIDTAKNQSIKGQLGLAIAKIGDGRAVEPMVEIVRDPQGKYLSRAIMTAALGVIGDLEWIPSLNKISKNINYRALNDPLNEVLSIL